MGIDLLVFLCVILLARILMRWAGEWVASIRHRRFQRKYMPIGMR